MFPADLPNFMLSGTPALYCVALLAGFNSLTQRPGRPAEARPPLAPRSEGLNISVAESPEALADAIRLVRRRYAWRGYETGQLAASAAACAPSNEVTLLAAAGRSPLGTLTLLLDSPLGLGAEEGYPGTIAAARDGGRRGGGA